MVACENASEGQKESVVCFEPYLSKIAQNVVRNPIRKVVLKMQQNPGCLWLAGGRPPKEVFPDSVLSWGDENFMNYGPSLAIGTPEMKKWAREFIEKFHEPPGGMQSRDVLVTSGNTDGITKTLMLLTDPGDIVLADEVTYPGMQASAVPLGRRVLGVALDEHGMIPESLEAKLKSLGSGEHARILYVTPHGQNPTGASLTEGRKDALYALARTYGLTILEDDPYVFVQLVPTKASEPLEEKNMPGITTMPKSFLARDTDCRVLRLDTVSKMIAPGYRLGWVTGPKAVMAKWSVLGEVFTWSLSGAQQKHFLDLVTGWGSEGLHHHLQHLQYTYARRRGFLMAACERHLVGLCKWHTPDFGMFFWLEVIGCSDTDQIIDELIETYGIALVPGSGFKTPEGASAKHSSFFRVSFSQLDEGQADKAMSQLKAFLTKKSSSCYSAGSGPGDSIHEAAARLVAS
jgi:DNA-binding transcriptional MocR family regulator